MRVKTIVAILASAVSGAAMAQSNVTVSGQVRMSVEQYKLSDVGAAFATSPESKISDQSSRMFFKGKEDLGDGSYVAFQIETRFTPDAGTFSASGNDHIKLGGNWGSVLIGRQDMHYGTKIESYKAFTNQNYLGNGPFSQVNGTVVALASRTANAIQYDSPKMGGFSASVGLSTAWAGAEGSGVRAAGLADPSAGGAVNLAMLYANGPITAGYSYWNATREGGQGATRATADQRGDTLQFAYKLPMGLKLGLAWNKSKLLTSGPEFSRTAWLMPLSYEFGSNQIAFTYLKANATSGIANSGAKAYTLNFGHALSKRTNVGVAYTRLNNDAGATYDLFGGGTSTAANAGADVSQWSMNIYHSF